jgi:streptogramin lyase/predicted Ser/Thr protein kinase
MSDRIGTEIAGYRIESLIARGGMGEVYLATQSFPERKVALKLLPHDLASDQAFRERFIRESNAAASVEHPNIVPVYGAGESSGELYIAMRYVEGEDLRALLDREGPLAPERALRICAQIADALDEAHDHGLVHRDVKPGNILIAKGDRAYLTDFGLIRRSKLETDLTKTGQFMGTVDYVAPEQIKGEEVDGRADIYSLGCVLYECLTGDRPFARETEVATLYAHLEEAPPKPRAKRPELPPVLDEVVPRATAKTPDERYGTAGEFARAARRALEIVRGEGDVATERVPWQRRSVLVAAGGALLLFAAVAVFVATRGGSPPERATRDPVGPPLGSVVRLDPTTGAIAQTIRAGTASLNAGSSPGLAAGEGGVWVGNVGYVLHVDPVNGTLRETIPVQSFSVEPIVGFRAVWVATDRNGSLLGINPATDALLPSVQLSESPAPENGAFPQLHDAVGEGAVWVSIEDRVVEVDPIRNQVIRRIDTGTVDALAAGAGGVWVIDSLAGRLTEFDPTDGAIVGSLAVPISPDAITIGGGSVWLLDRGVGTVLEIDAETLAIRDTVRVGSDETDITFGAGAVWLADGTGNSLTRIDPVTHEPRIFSIGSPVLRVAVDPDSGSVWGLIAEPA